MTDAFFAPILVTGAASGIGEACAEVLAEQGAALLLWDIDEAGLTHIEERAFALGAVAVESLAIDVSNLTALTQAADAITEKYPAIKGFIHAAGIDGACALDELNDDIWQRTMNINLRPLPFLAQRLLPSMQAFGSASIVAIASINATQGHAANPSYSASKGGMLSVVRSLADDLGRKGVRINSLSPGHIETAMTRPVLDHVPGIRDIWERAFLGRVGQAKEVAEVAAFLLSDKASFVTATEIVVDGGRLPSQR